MPGTLEDVGDSHVPRRMFAITPKGDRFLGRWLCKPPRPPRPVRDEILVRLLIQMSDQNATLLPHLLSQEESLRKQLTRLRTEYARTHADEGLDDVVRRLNLDATMRHAEAHLCWLEQCRETISGMTSEELSRRHEPARIRRASAAPAVEASTA
jgi:DNA-binding PadR family transcriptional regulator